MKQNGPVSDHSSFEELLNEIENIRCRCFRPIVVSFKKENRNAWSRRTRAVSCNLAGWSQNEARHLSPPGAQPGPAVCNTLVPESRGDCLFCRSSLWSVSSLALPPTPCLPLLTPIPSFPVTWWMGGMPFSPLRGTSTWSSRRCEEPSGLPCACWWSCTPRARTALSTPATSASTTWRHAGTAPCVRSVPWRGGLGVPGTWEAVQRWYWPEGRLRGQCEDQNRPGGVWCQIWMVGLKKLSLK